jgi:hypothetical protein
VITRERIRRWQELNTLIEQLEDMRDREVGPLEERAHAYLKEQHVYERAGSYPRFLRVQGDDQVIFHVSNGRDPSDNFEHAFPLDWPGFS